MTRTRSGRGRSITPVRRAQRARSPSPVRTPMISEPILTPAMRSELKTRLQSMVKRARKSRGKYGSIRVKSATRRSKNFGAVAKKYLSKRKYNRIVSSCKRVSQSCVTRRSRRALKGKRISKWTMALKRASFKTGRGVTDKATIAAARNML